MITSLFSEARLLLEEVEARLVSDFNNPIRIIGFLKRLIVFPAKFLHMGISERLKGFSVWAFLTFSSLLAGAVFLDETQIKQPEVAQSILFAAWIVPMFLVLFALPSIFAHSGVSDQMVQYVHGHLKDRGFTNSKEIELLKKTLKPFEDKARSRITVFKWIVGLGWGGFTYIFSKSIETSLTIPAQLMVHVLTSTILLLVIGGAYLCVWGYEAATDKLFKAIEFGCNDYAFVLEGESPAA